MSHPFNPQSGLILVLARLRGPKRLVRLRLVLDTGADQTILDRQSLETAGYDPANSTDQIELLTASGTLRVPALSVLELSALGTTCRKLEVIGHTLPLGLGVQGLLGLDFLRGRELRLDFRAGQLELK